MFWLSMVYFILFIEDTLNVKSDSKDYFDILFQISAVFFIKEFSFHQNIKGVTCFQPS